MKIKKILKTLLYLVIFGFLAKILSIFAKIIVNRAVGIEGMGLYSLVNSIMILLYTIGQIGLPQAIAKLISSKYHLRYKVMISSLILGCLINIILFLFINLNANYIAIILLKNEDTIDLIKSISYLTPLVFLSGYLKGYCNGINQIKIPAISQIIEESARILFLLFSFNFITFLTPKSAACYAILSLIIAEIFQIISLIIGNHKTLDKNESKFLKNLIKKENIDLGFIIKTSLPITLNRLITSVTYFFEPIIYTYIMTNLSYSSIQITYKYGLLESYAMPILFLPGFFSTAFASYLLPNTAKLIATKEYQKAKKLCIFLTSLSLVIGVISSITCYLFPHQLLNLLYNDDSAANYVKILSIPFILYYIEAPLNCAMFALSYEKKSLIITIISSVIRVLSLFILVPIYDCLGVAYSTIIEVLIIVFLDLFFIIKFFRNHH